MKRVLLVCTVHRETGLASASELQSILERIRPEVIFLELPPADFDNYFDGTRKTLESTAVARYRAIHPVELVPVDLPPPTGEFIRITDYLFESIEEASPEYCRLSYENSQYVSDFGFTYLNSANSSTRWSAIHKAMRKTIEELGDRRLIEFYASWTHANEVREEAMIKGVEDYSKRKPFETGVLLVGASHRQSIVEKSRTVCRDGLPTLHWDFEALDGSHRDEST